MEILKYAFYPSKILKTGVLQKKKKYKKNKKFSPDLCKKKIILKTKIPPGLIFCSLKFGLKFKNALK